MRMSLCFKCGSKKSGAFNKCQKCGVSPQTEEEFSLSIALTDYYFGKTVLDQIGADIEKGFPFHLDPQARQNLFQMRHTLPPEMRLLAAKIGMPHSGENQLEETADKKKPWWKIW